MNSIDGEPIVPVVQEMVPVVEEIVPFGEEIVPFGEEIVPVEALSPDRVDGKHTPFVESCLGCIVKCRFLGK